MGRLRWASQQGYATIARSQFGGGHPAGRGGQTIKLKYLCPRCEFNWRSCHHPKRPNVTREEGCQDFWPRGKEKPPDTGKLSSAWIDGVDLSGLKKGKRPRHEM